MASTLVFPDGVRLAHWDELPGPEGTREEAWASVLRADIHCGFVLADTGDPRHPVYAEANVDAPQIWDVFRSLCESLLGDSATLVVGEPDDEPAPLGTAPTATLLDLLEPYRDQLSHNGWLQFGLVHQTDRHVSEVFVAPTKHFKIWAHDAGALRDLLQRHAIPEVDELEFVDQYPRTTVRLTKSRHVEPREVINALQADLRGQEGA